MKKIAFLLFLFCKMPLADAQLDPRYLDSLKSLLPEVRKDTQKVNLLSQLGFWYSFFNPDSSLLMGKEGLELAQIIHYKRGEIDSKTALASYWWSVGDYVTSIKLLLEGLLYFKDQKDAYNEMRYYGMLGTLHRDQGDYYEALKYSRMSDTLYQRLYNCDSCGRESPLTASIYYEMGKFDSALAYLKNLDKGDGWSLLILSRTHEKLDHKSEAFYYYGLSINQLVETNNRKDLVGAYNSIANLFRATGNTDSAFYYANLALAIGQEKKFNKEVLQSYLLLSGLYNKIDLKKAFGYLNLAMAAKDSLYNQEKQRQILGFKFTEELGRKEKESAESQARTRVKIYILLTVLTLCAVIAVSLWYNNSRRKKAYALLQRQKVETDYHRSKAEQAFEELKSTQSQLIQSEKMASLGELTAGIAHEIQNPLNFVNNFSEVNKELVEEMQLEMDKGNYADAKAISNDIKENEEKINHHGKRAGAIVKGMLQHSRATSSQKEPTGINALADEYLRLSYHGVKAKDKSFNATLQTEFDASIEKINIIPQDIGRVLLNLYNNAFYAVTEKNKQQCENYQPTVSVSTKKINDKIEIRVKDNGNGIAQKALDKIFQPFFTTKPTGQGTGLGLSLSYDIIKAHGGEIKVETKEGEYAEFVIILQNIY